MRLIEPHDDGPSERSKHSAVSPITRTKRIKHIGNLSCTLFIGVYHIGRIAERAGLVNRSGPIYLARYVFPSFGECFQRAEVIVAHFADGVTDVSIVLDTD
jgi:hypothetical protein